MPFDNVNTLTKPWCLDEWGKKPLHRILRRYRRIRGYYKNMPAYKRREVLEALAADEFTTLRKILNNE